MQQHAETLGRLNTRVAVVTFETAGTARAYVDETGTRWPILVDEAREVYRAYGVARGTIWNVWGFPSWGPYFREMARGVFPRRLRADSLQLGGDFLIDPDGVVRFGHVGRGPGDRPGVDELLSRILRPASPSSDPPE